MSCLPGLVSEAISEPTSTNMNNLEHSCTKHTNQTLTPIGLQNLNIHASANIQNIHINNLSSTIQ